MMVWLIILAVIIFIALLRFGVALRYNEDGFVIWARIGFFSFKIYPTKKKKIKKKEKEKSAIATRVTDALGRLKPESLKELKGLLPDVKSRLLRIKRRILIKRLDIEYTAAGSDPSSTAITFGRANALLGAIWTVLQNNLRIKRSDFRILADFESDKQKICFNIAVTMAVWEAIYVAFTILMLAFSAPITSKYKRNAGKEVKQNG